MKSFVFFFQKENADQESCCWRNLFSCINLVRILQKLTKWKHSRTMVTMPFFLVLFVVLETFVFFSSIRLSNGMEFWFLVITGSLPAGCFPHRGIPYSKDGVVIVPLRGVQPPKVLLELLRRKHMTGEHVLELIPHRGEKISSHAQKTGAWYLL